MLGRPLGSLQPPLPPPSDALAARAAKKSYFGRNKECSLAWGLNRMTPVVRAATGTVEGWQMTCCHPEHIGCNKTRSVRIPDEDSTIRLLKAWAISGLLSPDKGSHKDWWTEMLDLHKSGRLPTDKQLDELVWSSWGNAEVVLIIERFAAMTSLSRELWRLPGLAGPAAGSAVFAGGGGGGGGGGDGGDGGGGCGG